MVTFGGEFPLYAIWLLLIWYELDGDQKGQEVIISLGREEKSRGVRIVGKREFHLQQEVFEKEYRIIIFQSSETHILVLRLLLKQALSC